ncbi:glycosyltransferase family 2 protein [Lactobacillus johnsonii]|uniref:glycosyltransferase family 2 protein n=1 Tax=Lactobacillus johnsonii TaxID=33959 RepID=UPI0028E703C1|nr:glycosyltransferase family 2 protein [Lactobacillus johnsonii]MDT9606669.1 glycosyltransferase family 2 protein [Lactobacillus johnsonii]
MLNNVLAFSTLVSIWFSLLASLITLYGAIRFWIKHSKKIVSITPLKRYPTITIVVPAHNEELVIAKTTKGILDLNYPASKIEVLLYADNCQDKTAVEMQRAVDMPEYKYRNVQIIKRQGSGGKAGVLNDALEIAQGEYICVYDADALPEQNALYFLVKKVLENPSRYMATFGRNKTRNARQNFLTRCINQEVIVSQRIQHVGVWNLFKIGRIPGTNFIINTEYVRSIGGWQQGALTEDTEISFRIMEDGYLIALAYNSEAFEQEPEHLRDYYYQRLRWAKGNYQVVINNFKHLFDRSNWRVKLETFYLTCIFFWFNLAVVLSDIIFFVDLGCVVIRFFNPKMSIIFAMDSNLLLMQLLLINWLLMILLYVTQINLALATQYGQATSDQIWLALGSYFTYSQLFIAISIQAVCSVIGDKIFKRDGNKWVKTKRFAD